MFIRPAIFLLGVIFFASCSQEYNNKAKEQALKVYHQAMQYGDLSTAIHATHLLLAVDSSTDYLDTLAVLYYQTENYPQAIQAAQNVLDKRSDDEDMPELIARAYQNIGRPDLALPFFIALAEKTGNIQFDYQVAASNFLIKQYDESSAIAKKILEKPGADSSIVIITFGNQRQQAVPVKAAVHNLLGSIEFNKNNNKAAGEEFKLALEEFPQFALAAENLQKIK